MGGASARVDAEGVRAHGDDVALADEKVDRLGVESRCVLHAECISIREGATGTGPGIPTRVHRNQAAGSDGPVEGLPIEDVLAGEQCVGVDGGSGTDVDDRNRHDEVGDGNLLDGDSVRTGVCGSVDVSTSVFFEAEFVEVEVST